jgi:hypothetical protein
MTHTSVSLSPWLPCVHCVPTVVYDLSQVSAGYYPYRPATYHAICPLFIALHELAVYHPYVRCLSPLTMCKPTAGAVYYPICIRYLSTICPLFITPESVGCLSPTCPLFITPITGCRCCLPPLMCPLFITPYVRCLSPLNQLAVYHPHVRCLTPLPMCPRFRKGDCQPFTLQKLTTGYKPITSSLQAAGLVTPQHGVLQGLRKALQGCVLRYEARYEARNALRIDCS